MVVAAEAAVVNTKPLTRAAIAVATDAVRRRILIPPALAERSPAH
jgi:Na+-translocating ferredoxin:NAD+ oxidoreductase RnfC subunit